MIEFEEENGTQFEEDDGTEFEEDNGKEFENMMVKRRRRKKWEQKIKYPILAFFFQTNYQK